MKLSLLAAVADNGVIGNGGGIPWQRPPRPEWVSEDMDRFRNLTRGNPVIMGRTTYNSLPKKYRPLPGRYNIVLSQHPELIENNGERLTVATNLHASLRSAESYCRENDREWAYCIGGQQVYEAMLPLADALEITEVHLTPEGDTHFPEIDKRIWQEIEGSREDRGTISFVTYERRD